MAIDPNSPALPFPLRPQTSKDLPLTTGLTERQEIALRTFVALISTYTDAAAAYAAKTTIATNAWDMADSFITAE